MTSSPTRGSGTSSSSPSAKSLFARLKSPLMTKSRNFTDFYIQPDDPHRQYAPGDLISGSVIIKVIKPLRITHLVVSLHGYAQVYKNPNSPGDAYKNYSTTVGSGKGKKSGSYFGNGFVSLFEDEVVLCGEGKLGEGVYHFNFELEFPSKGLPSSIDFERGTVSYMLTSTLTRPTTISPTASCDAKVSFMDSIDIASVMEPKPRVISLEPISRRSRTKTPRKRPPPPPPATENGQQPTSTDTSESARNGPASELMSVAGSEGPGSPAPSDVSFGSQLSSGASGTEYGIRSVTTATENGTSPQNGSRQTLKGKTITATIDVLKGGFLRGDHIPIRIAINHTKHVRSLKGIIITLYRQARVDMHPALPVLVNSKGDKLKSEDYYPKSRTGLGGLSLSSAGSSHLFRKDLAQSFAPLFVDPRTLTAEVKCAVRVPDEAFPTMSNVPGAMISFKYYIEVVVDIQGKLTGLDRMVPNAGLVAVPGSTEDTSSGMFSTWGGNFVDTDSLRREKGVVSCIFEVIVGTKDSDRNGKRKQASDPAMDSQPVHEIPLGPNDGPYMEGDGSNDPYDYGDYMPDGQYYEYGYDGMYYDPQYDAPGYNDSNLAQPSYQPPSQLIETEEGLSEKERIQRAEARLLPSEPPQAAGPSSPPGVHHGIPASAPVLPDDMDSQAPYFPSGSSAPSSITRPPPTFRAATAPSLSSGHGTHSLQRQMTNPPDDETRTTTTGSSLTVTGNARQSPTAAPSAQGGRSLPSLPPHSPLGLPDYFPPSSSHVQHTDDKQELQRRRLEMETSAPPDAEAEESESSALRPSAPPIADMQSLTLAPSAPDLDEEDEGLVDAVRPGRGNSPHNNRASEALPEYQR